MKKIRPLHINLILLFAVAILFRCLWVWKIPGINGDEAWNAVQMANILHGDSLNLTHSTGRPLTNIFYLGPMMALLAFFEPQYWIFRIPALVSGLALLPLSYYLLRNQFSHHLALIATILMACLPINIAYSRIGWDPAQICLIALIALYFSWRKKILATTLAFGAAFLIHPTLVFLLPLLLAPFLIGIFSEIEGKNRLFVIAGCLALVALLTGGVVYLIPKARKVLHPERFLHLATSFSLWYDFGLYYLRCFSGVIVYQHIPGFESPTSLGFHDFFFNLLFILLWAGAFYKLWKKRDPLGLGLMISWLLSLIGFFFLAGPETIAPSWGYYERFLLFSIFPGVLLASFYLNMFSSTRRGKRRVLWGVSLLGWLFLLLFGIHFFGHFFSTGGTSLKTFRTGPVEPKKKALQIVSGDITKGEEALVFTDSWWIHWPLVYLALEKENCTVKEIELFESHNLNWSQIPQQKVYLIDYHRSKNHQFVKRYLKDKVVKHWQVKDFGSRPLVHIWRLK